MQKIHKLSAHEAQKIAAGEVVERPANVVKELIENSIDAGASQIIVYLNDGGKSLIRVIDNGCGMSKEDASICFEHHATSKINSVNDLESISTFGFRGEALSSISSVSKTTLITKEKDAEYGHTIALENGAIVDSTIVSANSGTDISIQDIFYNVPARKKFLKSTETEWNQIKQLFQAFCLDYLNIHFQLFSEEKLVFNCPVTSDIKERITQLWDYNFAEHMILLNEHSKDGITIKGIISNHHYARYDRNSIFFFANKRWVKHQKLTSALLKGYLNVIQPGKFPAAAIFIEVDPLQIDVNIHPRKEEVQFLHPKKIESMLSEVVKESLEANLSAQLKKSISFAPSLNNEPFPKHSFNSRIELNRDAFNPFEQEKKIEFITQKQSFISQPSIETINHQIRIETHEETLSENNNYHLIGQFNKTYLLLEKEEGLYIVDQHAAHERILYELFSKRFREIAIVKLLFPHIITVTQDAIKKLESAIELFAENGIEIQIMSDTQLAIQSTPVHLKNQPLNDLINDVVELISDNQTIEQSEFFKMINEKIRAQMACKAAVKAGDILSQEQMQQLLDDLHTADNRFSCPHGRPTGWLLSNYEIEKKFKRKL